MTCLCNHNKNQGGSVEKTPFDLTARLPSSPARAAALAAPRPKKLLAKLGARVVISSRKLDACKEVADGIKKAGGDAHVIPCNISRREESRR